MSFLDGPRDRIDELVVDRNADGVGCASALVRWLRSLRSLTP